MISSATKKDRKSKDPDSELMEGPLVRDNAEAFLVWTFENAYDRWRNPFKISRERAAKNLNEAAVKKLKEETKGERETPYTDAKGGQQRYGGVSPAGWARYVELCQLISKNRKDNKESIAKVEQEVLDLVRKKHNRDQIEANQRARKPKASGRVATPVQDDPNFNEDDPDQWF